MGIKGIRTSTNTAAGAKAGIGSAIAYIWYFVNDVINWDITQLLQPDNLESLITWLLAFFGVGASIGAWNRDQQSAAIATYSPPTIIPGQPDISYPAPTPRAKQWFTNAELECKGQNCDCEYPGMSNQVMAIANDLRNKFGPLVVTSGYRCPIHNQEVGGSSSSYHVRGRAIDLKSTDASSTDLYRYLTTKYVGMYGFGRYKTFVHIDDRTDSWARKPGPDQGWQAFEPVTSI